MLKRARISLALAAVPAAFLYAQLIDFLIPAARFLFFTLIGFSIVSFLFAMFEDEPAVQLVEKPVVVPPPKTAALALVHAGQHG